MYICYRSFVGEPVKYDKNDSVEEVVKKVSNQQCTNYWFLKISFETNPKLILIFKTKLEMERLIKRHQRLPNSVWESLLDRFSRDHKRKTN